MAKADIQMPENFLKSIQRLGSEEDRIAESVLEAGAEVVETNVRSRLSGVIGSGTKLLPDQRVSCFLRLAFPQ